MLRVEDVTEDPDLPVLPLDVGVARRQPAALDGAVELPPHLTRFTHRRGRTDKTGGGDASSLT